ncbi:MAG: hypothetical protein AAFR71_05275 [Pseudomonadota bacterium]
MGRFLYALLIVSVGAVVAHLAVILLLPVTAPNTAARQLETALPLTLERPVDLSALQASGTLDLHLDPAFRTIGCQFDIGEAPFRLVGDGRVDFWSVSILDPLGVSIFSANDRIAPTPSIDLTVLSASQLRQFRQSPDPRLQNSIIVSSDDRTGYAIIRLFEPDESWKILVDDFVNATVCFPLSGFGFAEQGQNLEPDG